MRRLAFCLLALALPAPAAAQQGLPAPAGCANVFSTPETTQDFAPLQGSSDLNAQSGNNAMAAGLTSEGTLTVLRWPTPSSYDQIKHFSPDANLPRAGADPNMGAFLGVVVDGRTVWLRDLPSQQRFTRGDSDTIVTRYQGQGYTVAVRSVVAHGLDVLAQRVTVRAGAQRPTALVSFENLSLAYQSVPASPYFDWCGDAYLDDDARWDAAAAAIVHTAGGLDPALGKRVDIAVAMGTRSQATVHQVGGDAKSLTAVAAPADAYADAADGALSGSDASSGPTTGAVLAPLSYQGAVASDEVYFAAGHQAGEAFDALAAARRTGTRALAAAKQRSLHRTLRAAAMPRTRDPLQRRLARRALILLATTQAASGAIVASITTQPVYAEDWPRDSAYLAEAMDRAGMHARAGRHGRFLARTQATDTYKPAGAPEIPSGAWPMNLYDNGAAGGPIPYEFDEVGFGAWQLWRHYRYTHDRDYLSAVWPAIQRAGDLLVSCRDANGLQCRNTEDDSIPPGMQQTIGAAMTTYLGLGAAQRAARVLGDPDAAGRYATRRRELAAAMDAHLYNTAGGYYGDSDGKEVPKLPTYVFWPAIPRLDPDHLARHADYLWKTFAPSFDAPHGPRTSGFYDGLALLGLAHYDRAGRRAQVTRGLRWIAHTLARPGTGVIGENWRVHDGRVQTITGTPQLWQHALFYLAALETYGPVSRGRAAARARPRCGCPPRRSP